MEPVQKTGPLLLEIFWFSFYPVSEFFLGILISDEIGALTLIRGAGSKTGPLLLEIFWFSFYPVSEFFLGILISDEIGALTLIRGAGSKTGPLLLEIFWFSFDPVSEFFLGILISDEIGALTLICRAGKNNRSTFAGNLLVFLWPCATKAKCQWMSESKTDLRSAENQRILIGLMPRSEMVIVEEANLEHGAVSAQWQEGNDEKRGQL